VLRDATTSDLAALRDLFTRANDAPYDLGRVAEEKCFGEGVGGPPRTRLFEQNGRLAGAAVTCGRFLRILAVDRAARRQGVGSALLEDSGATVIAAEAGNYFTPGVVRTDEGTCAFFRARGYGEREETSNLEVRLDRRSQIADRRGETGDEVLRSAICDPRSGPLRPSPANAPRVLAFIEREFGRIWRFEAAKAFEREQPTAFVAMEGQAIAGFAVHDVNNRGLGFFGPTGVARSMRGRGIGCRLLLASLEDLRALGHARAVIPWTDAVDFYRKCCGAEPAHRFVAFERTRP
jgi:GNAT superfamily N-acetyltransferase